MLLRPGIRILSEDKYIGMTPVLHEDMPTFPSTHWPGYMRPSVLAMMAPNPVMAPNLVMAQQARQVSSGMSEIKQTQDNWNVCLDVNHFSPEELLVKTKDGVVEITDQTTTVEKVTSSLSPEGMLAVEAPLVRQAIEAPGLNAFQNGWERVLALLPSLCRW